MSFVPNTDKERQEMLEAIGVSSFDELIGAIPQSIRLKGDLNLADALSEYEAVKLLDGFARRNVTPATHVCFMGGGAYDHFIPSIVGSITERPEFKTAYTPYQAEVSQGTLQAMYEFQSMVAALTGMDLANASLYDGGSALAEACFLATAHTRRTEFMYAGSINPHYRDVVKTITPGRNLTFQEFALADGTCDHDNLKKSISDKTAAVIVQQPNAYGNLEDVREIEKIAHEAKALFIVIVNPISLGLLEAPGNYNADIVVAEGQSLGISLSFGGPYLGLFACKNEFLRKIPGRLSGVTEDLDGKRGYVLTLQTREQQIKREKATSNICTNQGLFMLAATVYMATMGKEGIKEVALQSMEKAHYLAAEITKIPGFKLLSDKPFFNEFLVKTPVAPAEIVEKGAAEGFLPGIDTSRFPNCAEGLLIAVTEKRTIEEMNAFVEFLKKYSK